MSADSDNMHLQQRLGYEFRDPELLAVALSHRSSSAISNERLEFLGDSILSLIVSDILYKRFAESGEGDLSRMRAQIVRAESLANVARHLEVGENILLGQGQHVSASILSDTVEALIGAVYLDSNLDECRRCVLNWFEDILRTVDETEPAKDAKTSLQEFLLGRGCALPVYRVVENEGEAHKPVYTMGCKIALLDEEFIATSGNKRAAEQMAAEKCLAAALG